MLEAHPSLLVEDKGFHELIRRAGARHVNAYRQYAGDAPLQVDDVLRWRLHFVLSTLVAAVAFLEAWLPTDDHVPRRALGLDERNFRRERRA